MAHDEHEKMAAASLNFAVVTFTDSRDESSDKSGKIIIEQLESAGHCLKSYQIIKEDRESMLKALLSLVDNSEIQAVVCNGGTGLSSRDNTIEVVRPLLEKEIEGFGELFRFISYQQIGAAAMLSRATAGIASKKAIFCLPGSSKAVRLAMQRLIVPQLAHLYWEANR